MFNLLNSQFIMRYVTQITFALLLLAASLSGQSFDFAAGLRLGTDWGMTARLRLPAVDENFSLEGILQSSFQHDESMVTLLGQQHYPILSRRLNLFLGGGLHKGWYTGNDQTIKDPWGISVIGGAEISIGRFNLSYDIKPALHLSGGTQDAYLQSGFSLRYILAKRFDIFQRPAERRRAERQRERQRRGGGSPGIKIFS